MTTLKLIVIGDAIGVVLPREVLERLHLEKGDTLYALETPSGIELIPYDPESATQMQAAESIMREDRDALRQLAE